MSRYDPNAVPFWEKERGGPITEAVRSRERLAAKLRLKTIREDKQLLKSQLTGNPKASPSAAQREYDALRAEERQLLRVVG